MFFLSLIIRLGYVFPPKILHQSSIDTPSFLHRNDGPSMDYRWSILYEKREDVGLSPLGGKKMFRLRGGGFERILLALELCEEIRSVKFYEQEITKETDV